MWQLATGWWFKPLTTLEIMLGLKCDVDQYIFFGNRLHFYEFAFSSG